MCDPVTAAISVIGGAVAGKAMRPKMGATPESAAPDPEAERQRTEAEAAQRANARLATDNRRRREQGSLIARGAPQPTLGDEGPMGPINPLSGGAVTRRSTARTASLLARGGATIGTVTGGGMGPQRPTTLTQ